MRTTLKKNERGAALIETAITIPIILLISVGIFEFGKAYQTSQVLVNAAREGARQAILVDKTDADVIAVVEKYMTDGGLPCVGANPPAAANCSGSANVSINRTVALGTNTASQIDIQYPFNFMVLNPVVRMVTPASKTGQGITMKSTALMRNEG
jgi:Flp pilus assembly protein TadG